MTKILDVTNGEFICFVSSIEYDNRNLTSNIFLETFEDTYKYSRGELASDVIRELAFYRTRQESEFEIIYD